jgi:transcriptional regulator with XRE-family HTH domain
MSQKASPFGQLLRYWRTERRRSQLDLAIDSDVSSRHVSFLETGRAKPSREMVLRLAEVLDVPLRDRNSLLHAAGFAPVYRESDLDDPALADIRRVVEFILEHHNPYPAVALDRHWQVLAQNRSAGVVLSRFVANPAALLPGVNLVDLLFSREGARPFIVNWDEAASAIVQRLHREVAFAPNDDEGRNLLAGVLAADEIPDDWRTPRLGSEHSPILPLHLKRDDLEVRLFSAITTLGTPLDVTLNELRLETFFPADEASNQVLRELVG